MGRIIEPIGDRIIIPKRKIKKPKHKMWMGIEENQIFKRSPVGASSLRKGILTPTSGGGTSTSASPSGGADFFELSDTLNANTNWTADCDTWTHVDGTVTNDTASIYSMYRFTAASQNGGQLANSYRQWVAIKLGSGNCGAFLRGDTVANSWRYVFTYDGSPNFYIEDVQKEGDGATNDANTAFTTMHSGDWIGYEVVGTGADTDVTIWDLGAIAPTGGSKTWGAGTKIDHSSTAANSGLYVGLYAYNIHVFGTSAGADIEFYAGSYAD